MNNEVYLVDREDQVKWYIDVQTARTYCLQLQDNHHYLRSWLRSMTQGVVVISGQGQMPRCGTTDHPSHSVYNLIQRDQWKVYFEDESDAMAFKLVWGGDQ